MALMIGALTPACQVHGKMANMNSSWDFPTASGDGFSIGPNRASDNTEKYLRSLIYSGQLAPGEKLPPERELSKHLGISTVTLRAALRSLEANGLIVVKLGAQGGSQVSDEDSLRTRWSQWMETNRDRLLQILEYRKPLELLTASLAASRRTPAELEAIKSAILTHANNRAAAVRWHLAFHDALTKAAHNPYLEQAMRLARIELFVPVDQVMQKDRFHEILGLHERVLAAVSDQDPARAQEEMRAHIEFTDNSFYHKAFYPHEDDQEAVVVAS
jgi:GntR family transcriptional repressor for pyruvate dehydrogenase complex